MMETNRVALYLAVFAIACSSHIGETYAYEDWQMERLFHPSQGDLESEANGSIFIYDGLKDKIADRALDENFARIGSMMFVRTVVTDESAKPLRDEETGEVIVEDDGCD